MTKKPKHYSYVINFAKEEACFSIFLRERFWLQAHRIICADGSPWTPKKERATTRIDLTSDGEASGAERPPKKKVKRERMGIRRKSKSLLSAL